MLCVPYNDFDLITSNTWEPSQEIVNPSAAFEILKKRSDRHARAFEQPFAADLSRDAFNCGTLSPIEHGPNPIHASRGTRVPRWRAIAAKGAGGADTGQTPIATAAAQLIGYGTKTAP